MIKNSIVGYGVKRANEFRLNPLNWRKHPQMQKTVIAASLAELGWIDVVIENVTTGNLIDGHERVMQALKNNDEVPYIQVELSENQEKIALGLLDPTTNMAETDTAMFEQLLHELNTTNPVLQEMFETLAERARLFAPLQFDGVAEFNDYVKSESDDFAVTFSFNKRWKPAFDAFVKKHGKTYLTELVLEIFKNDEN